MYLYEPAKLVKRKPFGQIFLPYIWADFKTPRKLMDFLKNAVYPHAEMRRVNASIVLFNHSPGELESLIQVLQSIPFVHEIFLVDNSPAETTGLKQLGGKVRYVFNNMNLGYGAAHNIAIKESQARGIYYHLVVNPDITFPEGSLHSIYDFMEKNEDIGQLMPKILYYGGEIQRLCKLLPTPFDLIGRRFLGRYSWAKRRNAQYELEGFNYDRIINTPSLSGCFMFFRTGILEKVGGFDTRFFMYLEDYDLTRRAHRICKTIFYPGAEVFHGYKKESYSNPLLLRYHVQSAIKYFNKWGWLFDGERKAWNKETNARVKGSN